MLSEWESRSVTSLFVEQSVSSPEWGCLVPSQQPFHYLSLASQATAIEPEMIGQHINAPKSHQRVMFLFGKQ